MSMFGEEIIDRLNENCQLRQESNPARKLINNTIGEWLDNFNDTSFFEQLFLNEAKGKYLDIHGQAYNVYRQLEESDEEYRQRIVYEVLEHLTYNYLNDVYKIGMYKGSHTFDIQDNTLVSDNPYLFNDEIICTASDEIQSILNHKFVLDNRIIWLNEEGYIEYILDSNNENIIYKYIMLSVIQNEYCYLILLGNDSFSEGPSVTL